MSSHYTIEDLREFASFKGGKCLSADYWDESTKYKWMCSNGHTWEANFQIIKQGAWCPACLKHRDKQERLENLIKIAKERGGECLSKEYINSRTKMQFKCAESHSWFTTPKLITKGQWCPTCGKKISIENLNRIRENNKRPIEYFYKIAAERGGKCLSKEYINTNTKLEWQCSEGHIWKSSAGNIIANRWCPVCAHINTAKKSKNSIEIYREIALKRGGKLLSKEYVQNKIPLLWECKNGHQWYANAGNVKNQNTWCPYCAGNLPRNIEEIKELAAKRGGKCLSEEYINSKIPLLWECIKGHQWKAEPNNIFNNNTWCPFCAGKHKTIKDMQELAAIRGGKCLSKEYTNSRINLEWQCSKGHTWKTAPVNIKSGSWCPVCARKISGENQKDDIETYRQIAKERGGKLLSEKYINSGSKLLWECAEGHQWKAIPNSIKNMKTWCRLCDNKSKTTISIKDMQELIAKKGGKCLSKEYINNHTKLEWQCNKGHIWQATPSNIMKNSWCPVCKYKNLAENQKNDIEIYRKIAIERGGKLLSEKYINNHTKLLWECAEGHQWEAAPGNIKDNKTWCPHCYSISRKAKSIEKKIKKINKQK